MHRNTHALQCARTYGTEAEGELVAADTELDSTTPSSAQTIASQSIVH